MIPIRLKKSLEEKIRGGFPWIYEGDVIDSSEWRMAQAGELASVETEKGARIGVGYINPNSQIVARVLSLKTESIDVAFFKKRFEAALEKRRRLFSPRLRGELEGRDNLDKTHPHPAASKPCFAGQDFAALPRKQGREDFGYYRLIHSEADFLPGLTIDRFGDIYSMQVSTAGMEALQPLWMQAFEALLKPKAIVLRNDTGSRKLEGLKQEIITLPCRGRGRVGAQLGDEENIAPLLTSPLLGEEFLVQVREYETIFLADLIKGQKTGWFYDQRDNRKMIADMAKGKTLLDVYSHSGGFGIPAARAGAKVTMVDSSKLALELAAKAAAINNVSCDSFCGDAFEVMKNLAAEKKTYDIVLADPPAFIKSKKDIAAGLKGYEKVARHAAALVDKNGILFVASCSHHASRGAFNNAVLEGIKKAGRSAEILKQTGAAPDHPIHPKLPQSEYLKGILLRLN